VLRNDCADAAYHQAGLAWLAAEAYGLAAQSKLKSAATQAKKHEQTHARLGTISLVDLVEPEPVWQRSLSAIAQLADATPPGAEPAAESERIIWELNTRYGGISLDAFQQKRKGSDWTKGRKVGLQRLYERHGDPEFAFLTDQDRALCRALEMESYQDGLRTEFFVRPFGDDGPFCRPGEGGVNLFANVDGRPKTARRNLDEERSRREEVIAACPELSARAEEDVSILLPSPIEALEALIELEDLVADGRVVLHWPRGQTLTLAGRASASQLHLHIRRDPQLKELRERYANQPARDRRRAGERSLLQAGLHGDGR